ncbi:MAG: hypothetical protein UU08_C0012G0012 [Candidatus Uhrbacteria bacterium GW2011_GWE2_40_58]|nr:MAG: hypothetical protein UU08_C0012G0012 [Candidatus Uhrbacteria bacterium GW2011_GWE2_40_58]
MDISDSPARRKRLRVFSKSQNPDPCCRSLVKKKKTSLKKGGLKNQIANFETNF